MTNLLGGRLFIAARRCGVSATLTRNPAAFLDQEQWLDLLRTRLHSAIQLRQPMLSADTNACRLAFSEADALPGIIADKYDDLIILQLLTKALDNAETRALITEVFREALQPQSIIERPDPRIRELEQLSAPSAAPLYAANTEAPLLSTRTQAEWGFCSTSSRRLRAPSGR